MKPVKSRAEISEMVQRVQKLRGPSPNSPKGLPKQPSNDEDSAPERKYRQEGLADPGYINFISGTGFGKELW